MTILIAASFASSFASPQAPLRAIDLETAFEVRVETGKAGCTAAFGGRRFDVQALADELFAYARRRGASRAVIRVSRRTPDRCLEGVVDTLQRAGIRHLTKVTDIIG